MKPKSVLKRPNRNRQTYTVRSSFPTAAAAIPSVALPDESSNKDEELLVFGYACKIFPPDENSRLIAKNQHLILWNNNSEVNLAIDRYDCRASLHNLADFDLSESWNKTYSISDEESKLEDHLNVERYRALRVNEIEENIRQEEEIKRLHASIATSDDSYREVSMNYDDSNDKDRYDPFEATNDDTRGADDDDDTHSEFTSEKPFTAPPLLNVPSEMEIPPTEKMNAVIEKTAQFVSSQGSQMEIVLKAKQASNSQFQFLNFGHYLNPYYKHVVKRIKEGKYVPGMSNKLPDVESGESSSDDDGDYLHPSLFASASANKQKTQETEEKVKVIKKVDPDHPLAKLIEKSKAVNAIREFHKNEEQTRLNQQKLGSAQAQINNTYQQNVASSSYNNTQGYSNHATTHSNGGSYGGGGGAPDMFMIPPPPDTQMVVEEVAKKVAMGGEGAEVALLATESEKYPFLQPWHEIHAYYHYRKMAWMQVLAPPPPPEPESTDGEGSKGESKSASEDEESAPSGPICFSIKPNKSSQKKKKLLQPSDAVKMLAEDDDDEDEIADETAAANDASRAPTADSSEPSPFGIMPAIEKKKVIIPDTVSSPSPPEPDTTMETEKSDVPATKEQTSVFTAVTSTGETASISTLREKQAARKQRMLMFLKKNKDGSTTSDDQSGGSKSETTSGSSAAEKTKRVKDIASEDIFDLSEPPVSEESSAGSDSRSPPVVTVSSLDESSLLTSMSFIKSGSSGTRKARRSPFTEIKKDRKFNEQKEETSDSVISVNNDSSIPSSYSQENSDDSKLLLNFHKRSGSATPTAPDKKAVKRRKVEKHKKHDKSKKHHKSSSSSSSKSKKKKKKKNKKKQKRYYSSGGSDTENDNTSDDENSSRHKRSKSKSSSKPSYHSNSSDSSDGEIHSD